MNITVFTIAFLLIMISMVVFLLINSQSLPVVKAGKVTKYCNKSKCFLGYAPKHFTKNGMNVDLQSYEMMYVRGNSLQDYHIQNGQRIYVRQFSDTDKKNISTYPVLVFRIIDSPKKNDAEFKLRKFVGYVDDNNWDEIYGRYQERIRQPKEQFVQDCNRKYQSLRLHPNPLLALSETYDEDTKSIRYSLHPVETIYGKVEYAI